MYEIPFGILSLGHWNLFEICYLEFVILIAVGLKHETYSFPPS